MCCTQSGAVCATFPGWRRPVGLEKALSHSGPFPQVSHGSLAQALQDLEDISRMALQCHGVCRGPTQLQGTGTAALESPTALRKSALAQAAHGSQGELWGDLGLVLRLQNLTLHGTTCAPQKPLPE